MQQLLGSKPGLLDPTQPARLFGDLKNSDLFFASFNPFVASSTIPDLRDLSINNHGHRPKRIVLQNLPTGEVFWRFVPKARMADNVEDEGTFPRAVSIDGVLYECSQEQWDIYKLDPLYDCFIPAPPSLTPIVTRVDEVEGISPVNLYSKRPAGSPTPEHETFDSRPRKRFFGVEIETVPESDEDPQDPDMSIDPEIPSRPSFERTRRFRLATAKSREDRRQQNARRDERLRSVDRDIDCEMREADPSTPYQAKRKVTSLSGATQTHNNPMFTSPDGIDEPRRGATYTNGAGQGFKRTRTVSPQAVQRELEVKRLERERRKRERLQAEDQARREQRAQQFIEDLFNNAKRSSHYTTSGSGKADDPVLVEDDSDKENSDEVAHRAALEESRRKIADLEKDRPLWEEESRKRNQREQEENLRRLAAEEKIKMEARAREEEARRQAEREACLKAEQEEARRRAQEQRRQFREQEKNRWSYGPWTPQRALERYRSLCEAFDASKFSDENPLSFDDVPWPVLHHPTTLTVDDIDWNSVEHFFQATRPHMRSQDYKVFVEKSHRRFHPDRWRSRRLLTSIADETERNYIELATTVVSQALTPIWRAAKF